MLHQLVRFIRPRRSRPDPAPAQNPPLEDVLVYLIQRLEEHVRLLEEINAERPAAPLDTSGSADT
jgi:hypothetical protein